MPRALKIPINHLGTVKTVLETICTLNVFRSPYLNCPFYFFNTKEMSMLVIFSLRRYINEVKGQQDSIPICTPKRPDIFSHLPERIF